MTRISRVLVVLACLVTPSWAMAQSSSKRQGHGDGLDPADIVRPLADSWPTYSGDYSGKRYSSLTQIVAAGDSLYAFTLN
jgi:alcohol dehydrogenase (cytochrome c)